MHGCGITIFHEIMMLSKINTETEAKSILGKHLPLNACVTSPPIVLPHFTFWQRHVLKCGRGENLTHINNGENSAQHQQGSGFINICPQINRKSHLETKKESREDGKGQDRGWNLTWFIGCYYPTAGSLPTCVLAIKKPMLNEDFHQRICIMPYLHA